MYILSVIAEPKKKLYYSGGCTFASDIKYAQQFTTRTGALTIQEELMNKYDLDIQIEKI